MYQSSYLQYFHGELPYKVKFWSLKLLTRTCRWYLYSFIFTKMFSFWQQCTLTPYLSGPQLPYTSTSIYFCSSVTYCSLLDCVLQFPTNHATSFRDLVSFFGTQAGSVKDMKRFIWNWQRWMVNIVAWLLGGVSIKIAPDDCNHSCTYVIPII